MGQPAQPHRESQHGDLLAPLRGLAGVGVLLGLSGGADSVGMLLALREVGAHVRAAHFDHALRPDSAQDAGWVAELCERLDVPLMSARADVARVAQARGWNVEHAARTLRYAFLARSAREAGLDVIVTAHTRGDQAETVLHQLLRGEAVLDGIAPRRAHLRRPWLVASRADIERYLRSRGQGWLEDPSNQDERFTRNWLRARALPLLRERFAAADAALAQHAGYAREDDEVLQSLARSLPPMADLTREPLPVLRRFVALHLRQAGLGFHTAHLEELARALHQGATRHLTLPGGRDVTVTGGRLHLRAQAWPLPDFEYPAAWVLRHRRPGDRLRTARGTRKLSDVLTDAKIPRAERDRLWVLAEGSEVRWLGLQPPVWAAGLAPASRWDAAMGEALSLARQAARAGEVPVGAVVVCGERIVAGARNTSREAGDMTCHAELQALREAARSLGTPYLGECTLVVTLEPCPMCFGAAVESRVSGIVYGARNVKLGALGGLADLTRHPWGQTPFVTGGVRAGEASALLRSFFAGIRAGEDQSRPEL